MKRARLMVFPLLCGCADISNGGTVLFTPVFSSRWESCEFQPPFFERDRGETYEEAWEKDHRKRLEMRQQIEADCCTAAGARLIGWAEAEIAPSNVSRFLPICLLDNELESK